jgi:hypothetical protein
MIDITHLTKSQTPTTVKKLLVNSLLCSLLTNQKQVLVLGSFGKLNFNLRGGLGFQNKRTHQTEVGTLFSMILDRAEQVGVRKKTAAIV